MSCAMLEAVTLALLAQHMADVAHGCNAALFLSGGSTSQMLNDVQCAILEFDESLSGVQSRNPRLSRHWHGHCGHRREMHPESEVIVYVKLPTPGNVKTRLARGGLGADGAATFYKACAERTAQMASRWTTITHTMLIA